MFTENFGLKGLTEQQVLEARAKHGDNVLSYKKENQFLELFKGLAKEPMVLLLLAAALIYFISGDTADALFMSFSIVLVAAISVYQDNRSRNALEKLKDLTTPECVVIRNGEIQKIKTEELVVGDYLMVEEGNLIPADGTIIHSNDFSVNESLLTGESMAVYKDKQSKNNHVYSGTTVASGLAVAEVTATGNNTELGAIGKSLENIKDEKTTLEKQINHFVKMMVIVGAVVFLIVLLLNYMRSYNLLDSLLKSLTLAMSILPEEIPVAFTTFMALGSYRLMKMGIVVKQMKTVETLGSATVICTDKTGTITENKMMLSKLYVLAKNRIVDFCKQADDAEKELIRTAMWASEPIPFDPMEISLHKAYSELYRYDERPEYRMIHEYPLGGKPPMMTHIFENKNGDRIIAAKGAPEALMAISDISADEKKDILAAIEAITEQGYRVLAVAEAVFAGNKFPPTQQEFKFSFKGVVAFYDPPKKNIPALLNNFYHAGIDVKIITGDNAATTKSIATEIGFKNSGASLSGEELVHMNAERLQKAVRKTNIFTRMFPEAKLNIINALKANGEVVAMTGDGVNDGPALKSAHIGIAMGRKGTEIAKQAASLILMEDDLSKLANAVAMGRRIYTNLKKAIQYIISIHIPIILTVFIPLALGWIYPNIFTPVHVIFLELIMGPTCSIIYENEPPEKNAMYEEPRKTTGNFFSWHELATSILQGLAITAGTLFAYQYAVNNGYDEALTRSMVFTTLIAANIFLTLVNRSFFYSIFTTLKYRNKLIPLIILITVVIVALLLYVDVFTRFFKFAHLSGSQLLLCISVGFISVIWYEFVKWVKRIILHK
ncbi:cation-translocating P-type ATPase [Haoranjiania flava]|uniref:Cation-translocating P-type ATPase n=1 Tax=Haoranjiania flava TaxID=1856322 RepID=A0AAE3LQR4_9BACT|nr:cation-translocating P-type ATPase [Haoranjiania flava]MCU7694725.1 cation-translocating P-type ATPase [Haoranjiania flava]